MVVSAVEVVSKVSIDHEFVDKELLEFIFDTISDETEEVRVV